MAILLKVCTQVYDEENLCELSVSFGYHDVKWWFI